MVGGRGLEKRICLEEHDLLKKALCFESLEENTEVKREPLREIDEGVERNMDYPLSGLPCCVLVVRGKGKYMQHVFYEVREFKRCDLLRMSIYTVINIVIMKMTCFRQEHEICFTKCQHATTNYMLKQ